MGIFFALKTNIPKTKLALLDADCHRLCNHIVNNAMYDYENEYWSYVDRLNPLTQKLQTAKHKILQYLIVLERKGFIYVDLIKMDSDEYDFIILDVRMEYIMA